MEHAEPPALRFWFLSETEVGKPPLLPLLIVIISAVKTVRLHQLNVLTDARRTGPFNVLALPSATGGFGVAMFHEYLELNGKLECPAGVLGLGTAPQQSLAVFVVLLIVLAIPLLQKGCAVSRFTSSTAFVLGLLFALAMIESAPPMPSPPGKQYAQPLEMCRPPYRPAGEEGGSP